MVAKSVVYYKILNNGILCIIGERKMMITYDRQVVWTWERMMDKTEPDTLRTPICLN